MQRFPRVRENYFELIVFQPEEKSDPILLGKDLKSLYWIQ